MSPDNLMYATLAQFCGRAVGQLFGFYFLVPLNSVEFCNEWIFETPQQVINISPATVINSKRDRHR